MTPGIRPATRCFCARCGLASDQVWFTIAAQHLLGLLAGTALYLAVTRLGAPRWLGLIPAAVYLFSGDVLFFEHTLTVGAARAGAHRAGPFRSDPWPAAQGRSALARRIRRPGDRRLADTAPTSRVVLFAVVSVAALGVTGRRSRATAGGAATLGAAVVFVLYLLAFQVSGGRYLGLWDMTGWQLYGRVAPFAQCDQFDVPKGAANPLRVDATSRSPRAVPLHAGIHVTGGGGEFGYGSPQAGGLLYDFAIRAIRAQPRDYASAVITDLARYVRKGSPPFHRNQFQLSGTESGHSRPVPPCTRLSPATNWRPFTTEPRSALPGPPSARRLPVGDARSRHPHSGPAPAYAAERSGGVARDGSEQPYLGPPASSSSSARLRPPPTISATGSHPPRFSLARGH